MVKKSTLAKKTPSSKSPSLPGPSPTQAQSTASTKEQQRLLNIFSDAFKDVLLEDNFPALLQEIKQALFNRDFAVAFGREDYLEAYAARWSPTRALGYSAVFRGIRDHLDQVSVQSNDELTAAVQATAISEGGDDTASAEPRDELTSLSISSPTTKTLKMLSVGGCAAEHVAFASYLHDSGSRGTLTLLDSAPWSRVTSLLQTQLTTPPELSKYASAAAKASNKALLATAQLSTNFAQHDALSVSKEELQELVGTRPLVVTLLFTLNELYTNGGIGKTTKFLRTLGEVLPSGSMLLVADSPGSYSEAAVGKEKKRYPMQWLLNHTLVETDTKGCTWDCLESQDSVWFRLPEGLSYPIQLENMRYQMHVYQIQRT